MFFFLDKIDWRFCQKRDGIRTMRHVVKGEQYKSDGIYWLLTGMVGKDYQYTLLGRYIDGAFEFNNSLAKSGYIYQENIQAVLEYFE